MKKSTRTSLVSILKTVQVLEKRIQKMLDSEHPGEAESDSPNKTTMLWHHYASRYYDRWNVDPSKSARNMSILKSMIANYGVERSEKIIDHYFQMRDVYYVKACHPLTLLKRDADRVLVSLETGKEISQHEARQIDRVVGQQSLLDKIRDGKV